MEASFCADKWLVLVVSLPVAEAAGVDMVPGGLRTDLPDGDALLAAVGGVFDGIYRNFKTGEAT